MSISEKKHLLSLSVLTALISGYASQSLAVDASTAAGASSLHRLTTLSAAPAGPSKLASPTAAFTDHTHYDVGDQHVHHDHEVEPQSQRSIGAAQSDSFDT